jgi:hypothetical protein
MFSLISPAEFDLGMAPRPVWRFVTRDRSMGALETAVVVPTRRYPRTLDAEDRRPRTEGTRHRASVRRTDGDIPEAPPGAKPIDTAGRVQCSDCGSDLRANGPKSPSEQRALSGQGKTVALFDGCDQHILVFPTVRT